MQPLTSEWIQKADGDLATATREVRARKTPNYDAACFHAQQCAEKYVKALLQEARTPFGKTHNLSLLLDLLNNRHPELELLRPDLAILNAYAVEYQFGCAGFGRVRTPDELYHAAGEYMAARDSDSRNRLMGVVLVSLPKTRTGVWLN